VISTMPFVWIQLEKYKWRGWVGRISNTGWTKYCIVQRGGEECG